MWLMLFACTCSGPTPPPTEDFCDEVNAEWGETICVQTIPDEPTWEIISGAADTEEVVRLASYMVPYADDAPLPTLFVNQNLYPLHYDMLTQVFPDYYAGLTWDQYGYMVTAGEDRTYLAGDVAERVDSAGNTWYSFVVWEKPADSSTTPTLAQVTQVWEDLSARFGIGELVFVPYTENQEAAITAWDDAPFEMKVLDDDVDYEVYTAATGYGTVRLYTLDELEEATAEADYSYQDLLVLDEAPLDLERVAAGLVTGTRQGALSHLSVRTSARGTPNCFILDPFDALAAFEGDLVKFTATESGWDIEPALRAEAELWWDSIRPEPVEIPTPDLAWDELMPLLDLPTDTAEERETGLVRYGSKGRNLATLYQRIPAEYQIDGFLIPFAFYDQFMRETTWTVDLGAGEVEASFQETIEAWLADPSFTGDAAVRRARLDALREAMRDSPVRAETVDRIVEMVREVWGRDDVMVRFRSSSNAEDALDFSGAGLYDSESACIADEVDGENIGPSACDAEYLGEREVGEALTEVWASLWSMAAYEERDWYGIDHGDVAMGVLVDTRVADELANAVAFTGNPTAEDDRFLVEAQVGEYDVVSAEAGVYPETTLVTLDTDGEVTKILRVDTSSEREAGEWVLDDAQVTELSELLWEIERDYPVDEVEPDGASILLDTEWKVDETGQLIIKQVRPYLRDDEALSGG